MIVTAQDISQEPEIPENLSQEPEIPENLFSSTEAVSSFLLIYSLASFLQAEERREPLCNF